MPRFQGSNVRRPGLKALAFASLLATTSLFGSAANADTRIFTAQASEPGVTIEQAFRNGKELAVVGRGDGTTLFRIDEPSTVVGCANKFDFVTSTGEKINLAADLCVLDWSVTVKVAAATPVEPPAPTEPPPPAAETPKPPAGEPPPVAPPSSPPAAPSAEVPPIPEVPNAPGAPPPVPGEAFRQMVTVSLDQPGLRITALTLDGNPMTISGYVGDAAQFEIEGNEQGIVCEHAMGLTLSDGRKVTQNVNLCLNDWKVTVDLASAGETPPSPGAPGAPEPPSAPMEWTFAGGETAATLFHGVPNTDETAFTATCTRGSDRIEVTLSEATAPGLAVDAPVPVTFTAGGFSKSFEGKMGAPDQLSDASHPKLVIAVNDPLWAAMIRQLELDVVAGPAYSTTFSLKGSAGPVRQLVAACAKAQPAPTKPPPAAGGGINVRYACETGQGFRVTFQGERGTAVLNEQGAPPLTLRWVPEGQLGRYVAGDARLTLREDHVRWSRYGERARTCFPR